MQQSKKKCPLVNNLTREVVHAAILIVATPLLTIL